MRTGMHKDTRSPSSFSNSSSQWSLRCPCGIRSSEPRLLSCPNISSRRTREDEWQDARVVPAGRKVSVSRQDRERKKERLRETPLARPWGDNKRARGTSGRRTRLPPTRSFVTAALSLLSCHCRGRCLRHRTKRASEDSTMRQICPSERPGPVTMAEWSTCVCTARSDPGGSCSTPSNSSLLQLIFFCARRYIY